VIRFRSALALTGVLLAAAAAAQPFDPGLFAGLNWRCGGPFRGGRVLAVAGVPGNFSRFYFGAVGGGVWRSDNAGRTWNPIFDGAPVASIGAIAVAPSDPNVIYVGTGEADMRSDISRGDGVYKSTDGGRTWAAIGLKNTQQIGRILVDPRDSGLVFVAALGHAYGPNAERGVFRTSDGGRTWSRVLFRDENTGAIDVAFHPENPRIVLASLWQTRRPPWNVYPPSSGPGSGLYRSTDGGNSWKPVEGRGIPSEGLGRIGLAFAPGDRKRVYAVVDAKEGGLYVSHDAGETWSRASGDARIWRRGWYFGGVAVDPRDGETVYVCDTAIYKSSDGGRTFLPIKGSPGGDDYHQLWIDPVEPLRMIVGSDQGAVVSLDGGRTWSSWYNQPTAQLYHVSTDARFPYGILGAQQDSGSVEVSSRAEDPKFRGRDWRPIAGGGENGYLIADPHDSRFLFGGEVSRFDRMTLQARSLDPTIQHPGSYRRTWTLPLAVSPFDPSTLYFSHQLLFRSTDAGQSWTPASSDLTRENPGAPANLDAATAADSAVPGPRRGVVYAIAPSPVERGMIWCGTDDGLIWRTRDGGANWDNVTPPQLTAWSKIGVIEASRFDSRTAYAAVDRHRLDDFSPYVYRTRDGGASWSLAVSGLPPGDPVNVVREDPARRGLLYAGTESGVFVSFDDGARWQPLKLNLPSCSVRDIALAGDDLVIATHGRSFWVLDDVAPIRQLDARIAASPAWLFAPSPAVRLNPARFQGTPQPKDEPAPDNPPAGAILDYFLSSPSKVTLEILDGSGRLLRRFSSGEKPEPPDTGKIDVTPDWVAPAPPPSAEAGAHRIAWDLRSAPPEELGPTFSRRNNGLLAPPGRYLVRLTAGGMTLTQPLDVRRDPRIPSSDADLARQFEAGREIEEARRRVAVALGQAAGLRRQVRALAGRVPAGIDEFSRELDRLAGPPLPEEEQFDEAVGEPDSLHAVAVSLRRLEESVESADAAPTPGELSALQRLRGETAESLSRWQELTTADLSRVNAALEAAGLSPLRAD
jgi:photosystem II stability/assembly factor-like uncharacterized protein